MENEEVITCDSQQDFIHEDVVNEIQQEPAVESENITVNEEFSAYIKGEPVEQLRQDDYYNLKHEEKIQEQEVDIKPG